MDSIDKLLAELKTEYTEPKTTPQQNNLTPVKSVSPTIKSDVFIDKLLAEVQADILAKDAAEALQKQEELTQEKIRQEKLQAKQKAALEKPAKQWLAKLDPLSSEGLWFERFAESYPHKLAAAIDYLQTNS
ncbi:salt stress protein, Slr1339 family [Dolichospermum circinale]|jgi:hypothetical protein|uniref:salt stress protein, Slr1339 family n=1 Tax=Dolichospermum circinale TaxID=109265 RepID=UPI00232BACF7|nr:hypothetical protein [Dolichospermum circinale]MDB9451126.1 hypothetical protein [Dolichospermum circinale CS-547]